jgi:serine phosphatase RsbU (regulator of sigma subunit)
MPSKKSTRKKARILIVEDETIIALDIKTILEKSGHHVVDIVSSGASAILKTEDLRPDLVLMDIVLRGKMSGIKAAKIIRERFNIPVIYITAYSSEELMDEARETVPDGYLVKPINKHELYVTIEMSFYRKELNNQMEEYRIRLENLVEKRTAKLKMIVENLKAEVARRKAVEKKLRKSEEDLIKRNEIIENDIKSAQIIQRSLLPTNIPSSEYIIIDYRYLPLKDVGGDFFSFTPLVEGGFGLFIGDVIGHGVSAALFMSLVKFTTNNSCRLFGQMPGRYLKYLNDNLAGNMPSSYLTAIYAFFNKKNNSETSMTFASGGHTSPIVYRADNGEISFIKRSGFLIGLREGETFDEVTINLHRGDRIFFYTDGLTDVWNSKEKILGANGLISLFKKEKLPLGLTLDQIIDSVNRFKGKAEYKDDIILIGIEVV